MPDITACVNFSCSMRAECFRYRCVWTPGYQSVSRFEGPGPVVSCPQYSPVLAGDLLLGLGTADARAKGAGAKGESAKGESAKGNEKRPG